MDTSETKICQACKQNFTIAPEDAQFCEKMGVALPEICGICGIQRTMSWRNEHTLYRGSCAKCKKTTLSMYHAKSPYTVYCHECWWADDWNAESYAQEYDSNRPILEQFHELQLKVPREALINLNTTNCDFANHVRHSKDCYMVNLATWSESLFYCEWIIKGKDCMDCKKVNEGELLIECVDVSNCSRSAYLQDCVDCAECFFSYDLKGCTNCLFSSGLRNKSYHIFNKQVSKEEYEKAKKEILNGSSTNLERQIEQYNKLRAQSLRKYSQILNSKDSTGAYITNSNRTKLCFDAVACEDVSYSASLGTAKSGMYSYSMGWPTADFFFGSCVMRGGNNIKFSFNVVTSNNCAYCDSIVSCNESIASIGLKHKEFAVLNKVYSKEEYLKIKASLEDKGELGIFPDHTFSTFAYNESAAQTQYPLTKEEASERGFTWQDEIPMTTGQETIKPEQLPDNIKDIDDGYLKQVFKCAQCSRNYRVAPRELEFYRQFSLPLPRQCPQCRMLRRRNERTPYILTHRECMCTKPNSRHANVAQHFHGKAPCPNEFETPYAPDRTETVYCEQCYNAEIA